jgi:acetyl esterase/lipase
MKIETIQLFPDRDYVTLTSYVLEPAKELMNNKKRPAVLVCPGGGYLGCSDREAEPIALRFAAMGYHAFVLRYSTYFAAFATYGHAIHPFDSDVEIFNFDFANMKSIPEITYPAPLRDVGKAMLCIREHAEEWHIDTSKIVIAGGSAGGHLASLYATNWYKPVLCDFFKEGAEKFKPGAVILYYPLTDYLVLKKHVLAGTDQIQRGLFMVSNMVLCGTFEPTDIQLEELSPARQVNDKTPPMFIWATGGDELVPIQQTLLMGIALADKGIPFEIHVFEEGAHGLSLAHQASATAKSQINGDVAKWMDLAEAWLMKRFALDLPDKLPELPGEFWQSK